MKAKDGESVIWLFLKIKLSAILMKRSRRELCIDMVIHWGTYKSKQITLFPCFTFILETSYSFYSVFYFLLFLLFFCFFLFHVFKYF